MSGKKTTSLRTFLGRVLPGLFLPSVILAGTFTGVLCGCFGAKKEFTVGKDIAAGDITEFYYTYSTSTDPAEYQRYRFYTDKQSGTCMMDHDRREGSSWPLTEDDRTAWGTVLLTDGQWNELMRLLDSGKVTKRSESTDSGDAGPWTYLYWTGDKSVYQEFTFAPGKLAEFEAFCRALTDMSAD